MLEGGLSLVHGYGVVEIPLAVALLRGLGRRGLCLPTGHHIVASGSLLLCQLLGFGVELGLTLLLLLLLQCLDHTVDGLQPFLFGHHRQLQQRVLQVDGLGMGYEFVEHLRAVRQLLVVAPFLVEQSDGLAIAAVGVAEALHLPVQVAERQQQYAFLNAVAGGFLVSFLVGADGLQRVVLGQVDVADGVVHLVEVFLVVIVGCHSLQTTDHLLGVALCHYLGLCDAGVELQLVGRMTAHGLAEGLICLLAVPQQVLDLSHEEPLPGALCVAPLVLDDLIEIGHGLLVVAQTDIVVGVGVVPVLDGPVVYRVAAHVAYHVLRVVEPSQFGIALGQPGFGQAALHGLRRIEAAHV